MLSTKLMKQQVIPLFFSPKGRLSRGLFWKTNLVLWLGFLILVSCVMIFKEVFKLDDGFQDNGFSFAFLLYFYVVIVLTIKRLHDISWSGWLALPCILTGILWVIAGFIAGTPGKNKHGENPVEYEKNRLYINRETGLPPPPPPLDNPISKIVLYAIIISFLPSLAALGMVMPETVEKPTFDSVEDVGYGEPKTVLVEDEIQQGEAVSAACPSQTKTIFMCTTTNNKVIQVCDAGNTINYSFGKVNATPELAIKISRDKVTTYQWQGIGRYENYAINIPNGKTIYRVNDSLDKMSQQYTAGVEVSNNDKLLATVECAANKKITSKIQGIKLRPEM